MSRFSVFCSSADVLTRSPKNPIAAALSLGFTALCGWGMERAMDHGSGLSDSPSVEKPIVMPPIKSLTARQALALFEDLADNKTIPFEHHDGCFARAEKMRQLIESKGMQVMKIWAFEDADHQLHFREPAPGQSSIDWRYHVAVALPVIDAMGRKDMYVFDPTVFDAPARISEWAAKLNANPKTVELTKPDILPERYEKLAGIKTIGYTKQDYDIVIAREFENYRNIGSIRNVYPAKLRQQLCARNHDANACKKKGVTWRTAVLPSPRESTSHYTFKLSFQS